MSYHVVAATARPVPGRCRHTYHWADVDLRCDDPVVPGEQHCVEHLPYGARQTPPG